MKTLSGILLLLILAAKNDLNAQASGNDKNSRIYFFQPAISIGRNVRNYTSFPKTEWRKCISLDLGLQSLDTSKYFSTYYKNPQYGINLSYTSLGNDSLLGNEFSITPFFTYNPSGNHLRGFNFRLGIGLSYFTEFYDREVNKYNKAIGSSFTWSFQGIISKNILYFNRTSINISLGYSHASNGHTQLPNFGLNAAMLGLSAQIYTGSGSVMADQKRMKPLNRSKRYFLYFRQGTGLNELGGTTGPVGGKKGIVFSAAIGGGILFNQHIKVRTGFTYRYYELAGRYESDTEPWEYSQSSAWFASNFYFLLGCEFLVGHFGLDVEGGLNFYKPFYPYFLETFESGTRLTDTLKKLFPSRLGLNYYIISTERNPRNNISFGAHINANFGEADFSEFSIGYTRLFER